MSAPLSAPETLRPDSLHDSRPIRSRQLRSPDCIFSSVPMHRQRRGPGPNLVGFLGEQQPQRPQTSLDAFGRQPRERGYQAYQTYFSVPEAAGQTDVTRGLWYAFTAGSVRVISIANDDICYQDGGNS